MQARELDKGYCLTECAMYLVAGRWTQAVDVQPGDAYRHPRSLVPSRKRQD